MSNRINFRTAALSAANRLEGQLINILTATADPALGPEILRLLRDRGWRLEELLGREVDE